MQLITFLGRVPRKESAYRTTIYTFPDGTHTEPVAFFGWPLLAHTGADRITILGTPGSMWDHLFERDHDLGGTQEEARLRLVEAVEARQVEKEHLEPLVPLLSGRTGCEVHLQLIPYARDASGQVELLRILAGCVAQGEQVHLDVTHGFRHLPMLALLAALHLRLVKQAQIAGIWYGAYDEDTGQAPVHDLSGLLRLADWLHSLATYDKDGDYGVFAPLLGDAGKPLARAAFYERTTNPVLARQALAGWKDRIDGDPAYDLFRDELHRRIAWWKKEGRAQWEAELARRYLERRDFLRATVYALEGAVSAEVGKDMEDDYKARDQARESLREKDSVFKKLNRLRNAMAHGYRPYDRDLFKVMKDEQTLYATLKGMFTELFGRQA